MAENTEINLGCNWHTLYSDEIWFLVIPPRPAEPFLEGRFQTDAPDRTGHPGWVGTEYCVFNNGQEATCRMPLGLIPMPGKPNPFSFISDAIWRRLVEEFAKLSSTQP